jgi:hypothetical protein
MGRKFDVALAGRPLRICVSAVDEAWELWVCDRRNRLILAARIEIDDALADYRKGNDPIASASATIAGQLEQGLLTLPSVPPAMRCPEH